MLSFDTNVLVYSTDRLWGEKNDVAVDLLRSAASYESGLTEQCIAEFVHVATRKAKEPLADVVQIVRKWLDNFALLIPSEKVVDDTLDLLVRYKLSVWDARLLAVCAANGCDILFSEDMQDGAVYAGVRVIDPFNPYNAEIVRERLTL